MSTTQVKSEEDQNMADTDSGVESTASASTSTTSIDQVNDPEIQRKKEVFYEEYANAAFRFSDGSTLKVCSGFLAAEKSAFHQLFRSTSRENVIDVQDYDLNTFKLFLDCLMGFHECTVIDALLIFPIAWKYEAEKLIDKCIEILKPSDLNENFCLTLNIALFCQCQKLIDILINFLRLNHFYYFYKLLDEETYYLRLEPESINTLLDIYSADSYHLKNIFIWGKNYLKEKQKTSVDIKTFFIEKNIIRHLKLEAFETINSVLEFNESELGKHFFTPEEIFAHINTGKYEKGESTWVKVKAGDTLAEKFDIQDITLLQNSVIKVCIYPNRIILYEGRDFFDVEVSVTSSSQNFDIKCESLENIVFYVRILHRTNTCIVPTITVEVVLTFNSDGRILKRSPNDYPPIKRNLEDLYFIANIRVKQEKLK